MKNKYPVFCASLCKLLFQQQWETFKPFMWGSLVSNELHVHKGNLFPNLMFYGLSHDNSFFSAMSVSSVWYSICVSLKYETQKKSRILYFFLTIWHEDKINKKSDLVEGQSLLSYGLGGGMETQQKKKHNTQNKLLCTFSFFKLLKFPNSLIIYLHAFSPTKTSLLAWNQTQNFRLKGKLWLFVFF